MDTRPSFLTREKRYFRAHHLFIPLLLLCMLAAMFFGGMVAYANTYTTRVLPGVSLGDISIGGMTQKEVEDFIEGMNGKLSTAGIPVSFSVEGGVSQSFTLYPPVVSEDNVLEFVLVKSEKEAETLVRYGKDGTIVTRAWMPLYTRFRKPVRSLQFLSLDNNRLLSELREQLNTYEQPARDAAIVVKKVMSKEEVAFTTTSSSLGIAFNYDDVSGQVLSAWSSLRFPKISVETMVSKPAIVEAEIVSITERLPTFFAGGPLTLTYTDPHTKRERTWTVGADKLSNWIQAQKTSDGKIGFGIEKEAFIQFLEDKVRPIVDVEARDAKFRIGDNGKVVEFQGSRPGVSLLVLKTYETFNQALLQRTWHDDGLVSSVALVTEIKEPHVKTGEVNDLGINEILGIGHSNYSGSPPNRIKNIRHAVHNKLNGLLIKPGDIFSALAALKPFTVESGYLPELVIKGDRITPEVGGGLCQIGTTLFRMAMNSGMSIMERRNHSLVVTYYNDPRNGNPGTDATVYDSSPDFKFKNDTGSHVLLTTEMNEKTGDLYFTLWGTSDGRKGYYSEPKVEKWSPVGEPRYIESIELAPGEEKCQSAHPGAVASFTYVIERPDVPKEEREFRSHYRPLPKICLVGVLPKVEEEADSPVVESSMSEEGAAFE